MNLIKKLVIYNDNLLTLLAKYKYKGQELHHLIHKNVQDRLYRYDLRNLYPVDRLTHIAIHGSPQEETKFLATLPLKTQIWVEEHKHDSFKNYLIKHGQTELEFLLEKKQELEALLPNKYEMFLLNKEINGIATYSEKLKEKKELDRLKYFAEKDRKVQLRELKPKRKKLQLAKEYNHNLYLKAKERILAYKEQLRLQTN